MSGSGLAVWRRACVRGLCVGHIRLCVWCRIKSWLHQATMWCRATVGWQHVCCGNTAGRIVGMEWLVRGVPVGCGGLGCSCQGRRRLTVVGGADWKAATRAYGCVAVAGADVYGDAVSVLWCV